MMEESLSCMQRKHLGLWGCFMTRPQMANSYKRGKSMLKGKGTDLKQSLAQSDYITAGWNWFLVLAGKADEPVLVASVLYASVKLLPIVHFVLQCDVVVFIAQFVALDVGGLS